MVLSGGVFQNRLLTELVAEMHDDRFTTARACPASFRRMTADLRRDNWQIAAAVGGYIPCA